MYQLLSYAVAGLVGGTLGFILFPIQGDSIVQKNIQYPERYRTGITRAKGVRYNGFVASHDPKAFTITLSIPSSFPGEGGTTPMRFTYSDSVPWFSSEYRFKNDILEEQIVHTEKPRALPPGTLVTLTIDPRSMTSFAATSIYFLRKETL
jgi:hypothetical protein